MWVRRRTSLKAGIVLGAVGMYLLDPDNGPERRGRLLERIINAPRALAELLNRLTKELDEAWRLFDQARGRAEASLRSVAGRGPDGTAGRPGGPRASEGAGLPR